MTDAMRQELENAYLAGGSAVQDAWKLDSDISRFDEDALFKAAKELAAHSVMAGKVAELTEALERIAGGNLGDQSWQANYERIREVARAALAPHPKPNE